MKKTMWIFLIALSAIAFSACGGTEYKTNSNVAKANTNGAVKPEKTLKASIVEMENQAYEARKKKDGKFFEGFLSDGFVGISDKGRSTKASVVKSISESPCEIKDFSIDDEDVVEISDGVALLTSKGTSDYTCEGKAGPSPTWAAALYVKDGDKWSAAYHQTVTARKAEEADKADADKADGGKTDDKADADKSKDDKATADKAAADKPKDDKAKDDKAADKSKDDKATDDKSKDDKATADKAAADKPKDDKEAADKAKDEKPADDADKELVATLSAIDKSLWEAWAKKDGEVFDEALSETFVGLGAEGRENKAKAIKGISEGTCEIKTHAKDDFQVKKISDTIAILTSKASVDATCDGNPIPKTFWNTGIFTMKDGKWKVAFHMSTPAE